MGGERPVKLREMSKVVPYFKEVCKSGDLSLQRQKVGVDRRVKRMGADGLKWYPLFKIIRSL